MTKTFGWESTTDEVLDGVNLSGKRVLVTGVSAGLGVETARTLVAHGASVTGTARDLAKAKRALELAMPGKSGAVTLVEMDLASLKRVREAADCLVADGKPFDVIIANAGVMACPRGKTEDGFETQFGTNHLGHFVFVNRLVPLLGRGARIVTLSSAGHRRSDVNLEDPNFEHTEYAPFVSYGRSKTANVLFAVELDHRLNGRGIRATSVHPGGIITELGRHMTPELIKELLARRNTGSKPAAPMKNVAQGSATSVWCGFVAAADAVGGRYCEDCNVAPVDDDPESRVGVCSYALDPARAEALWKKSEEMVGEKFPLR